MRRIETLGVANRRILREAFGYRNIRQAMRDYDVETQDEAYELMREQYNVVALNEQTNRRNERRLEIQAREQHRDLFRTVQEEIGERQAREQHRGLFRTVQEEMGEKQAREQHRGLFRNVQEEMEEKQAREEHRRLFRNVQEEINKTGMVIKTDTYNGVYDQYVIDKSIFAFLTHWTEEKPYPLTNEQMINVTSIMNNYFSLKLKKYSKGFIRCYVVIEFLCFNTKRDETYGSFVMNRTLQRIDSNNIQEIQEHMRTEAIRQFNNINEIDYVYVYGINSIYLNVINYNPLSGSSYKPLPKCIENTHSIVNIKNEDNQCFLWCCIASRHLPNHHAERVNHYIQYKNEFKYDEEDMPMKINKISKFEKQNNVSINVYMLDDDEKTKIPVHISKQKTNEVINLFIHDGHYSLIKNFSRFCGNDKKNVCPNCLKCYSNIKYFKIHLDMCKDLNENGSYVKMPDEDTITKFTDFSKQKRLPVVIYADFEASLEKHHDDKKKYITSKHVANSYRIRIISDVKLGVNLNYTYVGEDANNHFVKTITDLGETITKRLREISSINLKPKLNKEEEISFKEAYDCSLCGGKLGNDKVRDHCPFTGKFCGAWTTRVSNPVRYPRFRASASGKS